MTRVLLQIVVVIASLLMNGCEARDSYYQCITEGDASEEQKRACMTRFQVPVPHSAAENIRGEAHLYEGIKLFSGQIHNRSSDWLITEIVVVLIPDGVLGEEHEFRATVEAGPLSSSHFSVAVYSGITAPESFIWRIVAAYGVPTK